MEEKLFSVIQKQKSAVSIDDTYKAKRLPEFSFIPSELLEKETTSHAVREKCAIASIVIGGISLLSWVVILFGILVSMFGVLLSVVGLRSNNSKYARVGLMLSLIGLAAAFLYAFAASKGIVNYNYFTTEFWYNLF